MVMYQYSNPSANRGNAYLALGYGIDLEMEGSWKCHNSRTPIGVTRMNVSDETKLKSSIPILRVIVN